MLAGHKVAHDGDLVPRPWHLPLRAKDRSGVVRGAQRAAIRRRSAGRGCQPLAISGRVGKATGMESFEQFVAVAMEAEGLIVSEAIKFPVQRQTGKQAHDEVQTHGYEVDLIGARADQLVLATVKSFFGSRGVVADHVMGAGGDKRSRNLYILLNDPAIRSAVVTAAAQRYGYSEVQVTLRLYVGRFAAPVKGTHEAAIREWAASQNVGSGPIEVYGLFDVVEAVRTAASSKTYRDNPVLVTMKVLQAAGLLVDPDLPSTEETSLDL